MQIEQSWPRLLNTELAKQGQHDITIYNGSVSGDTTGNGLAKLPQLLSEHKPDTVLIELGANDGLRGFQPNVVETNLTQIIKLSEQQGAKVLLMQIRIPPNYGKRYTQMFEAIYPRLAEQYSVPLIPFFLESVITQPEWMMADGLHPTADAQPFIAELVAASIAEHL
ncbi:Arylesterase [Vibrio hippocampi]|uniref:Arylesterase n=2 Tax=Vibrio hippocampi TaxID=654686 RepID=A0ABN8DMT8_9VIBR|nr:Arylesterase [Vibrio hippocampi]